MTLDEVENRVQKIRACAGDDETAHSMEDDLYRDFIECVATSTLEHYSDMARKILETNKIEFARWCA